MPFSGYAGSKIYQTTAFGDDTKSYGPVKCELTFSKASNVQKVV